MPDAVFRSHALSMEPRHTLGLRGRTVSDVDLGEWVTTKWQVRKRRWGALLLRSGYNHQLTIRNVPRFIVRCPLVV